MPAIHKQITNTNAFTANFVVTRALLRPGRTYAQSVKLFEPYDRIQAPYPEVRSALADLTDRARDKRQVAFLFVNNRLEGNAPGTIAAATSTAAALEDHTRSASNKLLDLGR